jgi:hypothetical protein
VQGRCGARRGRTRSRRASRRPPPPSAVGAVETRVKASPTRTVMVDESLGTTGSGTLRSPDGSSWPQGWVETRYGVGQDVGVAVTSGGHLRVRQQLPASESGSASSRDGTPKGSLGAVATVSNRFDWTYSRPVCRATPGLETFPNVFVSCFSSAPDGTSKPHSHSLMRGVSQDATNSTAQRQVDDLRPGTAVSVRPARRTRGRLRRRHRQVVPRVTPTVSPGRRSVMPGAATRCDNKVQAGPADGESEGGGRRGDAQSVAIGCTAGVTPTGLMRHCVDRVCRWWDHREENCAGSGGGMAPGNAKLLPIGLVGRELVTRPTGARRLRRGQGRIETSEGHVAAGEVDLVTV